MVIGISQGQFGAGKGKTDVALGNTACQTATCYYEKGPVASWAGMANLRAAKIQLILVL